MKKEITQRMFIKYTEWKYKTSPADKKSAGEKVRRCAAAGFKCYIEKYFLFLDARHPSYPQPSKNSLCFLFINCLSHLNLAYFSHLSWQNNLRSSQFKQLLFIMSPLKNICFDKQHYIIQIYQENIV